MGWTKNKPVKKGAYWIRGFHFGKPRKRALVEVRHGKKELMCNLHQINSDDSDIEDWHPVSILEEGFEWKGPLK